MRVCGLRVVDVQGQGKAETPAAGALALMKLEIGCF